MQNDLKRCFTSCCHFINNRSATEDAYEEAVRHKYRIFTGPGPSETIISCRNASGFDRAVENSVGVYFGMRMRRAYGTIIQDGKRPLVFDNITGELLREATDEDIKKWKGAWKQAVSLAPVCFS
jgi:hypothetical protein